MEYRLEKETGKVYTFESMYDKYRDQPNTGAGKLKELFDSWEKVDVVYDSKTDTLLHIKRVSELLSMAAGELLKRAAIHDDSKLESPEKELFDEFTPKLAGCTYGSDEYKAFLKELKVGLDHHYANNPHHPEHYENGICGMNLFDVIEMFFDWKAASERHANGDILKSIEINKERFCMSDQLVEIFKNTIRALPYL